MNNMRVFFSAAISNFAKKKHAKCITDGSSSYYYRVEY